MQPTGIHFEVSGPLREVIRYFYYIKTTSDFAAVEEHLAPNLETMLIFNFGLPVRISFAVTTSKTMTLEKVGIVGPLRKMLNYEVLPNADMIIAVFNPNGFYRLFQVPVNEIPSEAITDPDVLVQTGGFRELWQITANLNDPKDRIQVLMDYALAFIQETEHAAAPLLNGIPHFFNPAIQPVRAIAEDADLSERTIQLRFQKYLGFSPKEMLRFLRFKQVINALMQQRSPEVDWHSVLFQFGYHDQSHLIKDFRQYLGTTPVKFVREILNKEFCVSKPENKVL